MSAARRTIVGPMAAVTWVVAAGWAALAVYSFVELGTAWGIGIGIAAVVAAAATGYVASTMAVSWDADGVLIRGRGRLPWNDLESVSLHSGILSVPHLDVRAGRAVDSIPLDGLAWFGRRGLAHASAERLASMGGLGDVRVRSTSSAPGRRAA